MWPNLGNGAQSFDHLPPLHGTSASESRERKNGTFGNSTLSTAVAHNMAYRTSDYEGHMELYLMDLSSRTAQPWALRAAISRPPEGTVPTPAASWLSSM